MARILVHYDINDETVRRSFHDTITGDAFTPRFTQVSHSVYNAAYVLTAGALKQLRQNLRNALPAALPHGTRVFLEYADTTNNTPDIICVPIT